MPIKFTFKKLPVDADGKAYDSLEDFQAAQIAKLLLQNEDKMVAAESDAVGLGYIFVTHKDEIMEILELTMDARPVARGVKKPRKPKTETQTQPELAPQ